MKQRKALCAGAAIGILLLIFDTSTAVSGAAEGVALCIRTVVPTLLPFCVLSTLLLGNMGSFPFLRPICNLVGIPSGCEGLLAVSFVGGYPVGAQSVAQLYRNGKISKDTANRLLSFCSNAGPSFLFGFIGTQFSRRWMCWALWGIHILSAITVGIFLPGKQTERAEDETGDGISFPSALSQGIRVMASVCGCIVLFRIVIAFFNKWFLLALPDWLQVTLMGLLELTNGCCALERISDEPLRFIAAAAMLGFGGGCVVMQTAAVIQGLSVLSYLKGKIFQSVISLILSWMFFNPKYIGPAILVLSGVFCHEMKKRSSQRAPVGV